MRDLLNPNFSQFSDRVTHAAKTGKLNAEPLIRHLDDAFRAAAGVETVLKMIEANDVLGTDDQKDAPLSGYQTGALTGLAIFAMQALASDISSVAQWAEKHGVMEGRD
ncbi:hypothetical protein PI86_11025 [Burkholderia sp. A9]|uniref:hypothetical protein n=1 Tax=Burkholderia sp. A9 TaxID=1365108 RepID=UPI00057537F3|nr:hypothetical protein [Burkholderia sp. A9]KHK58136.1 hypothetical protein PI86_11025 [Burkholderia sp. A9]